MLTVDDLTVTIGKKLILDGVSFVVGNAELFTLVGPLEAGKTTVLRAIIGAVKPERGSIMLNGVDCINQVDLARPTYGYVPENMGVYENLTIREYMEMFVELYNLDMEQTSFLMENLIAFAGLSAKESCYIKRLSRAEKVKISMARALMHNPLTLILDNPMQGLNIDEVMEIKEMLDFIRKTRRTIIMTSDNIQLSAGISTSIAIIDEGRTLDENQMCEVIDTLRRKQMR